MVGEELGGVKISKCKNLCGRAIGKRRFVILIFHSINLRSHNTILSSDVPGLSVIILQAMRSSGH